MGEVEVFADETYSLGPAWDPSKQSELRYRFGGTGFPRPIHVSARKDGHFGEWVGVWTR